MTTETVSWKIELLLWDRVTGDRVVTLNPLKTILCNPLVKYNLWVLSFGLYHGFNCRDYVFPFGMGHCDIIISFVEKILFSWCVTFLSLLCRRLGLLFSWGFSGCLLVTFHDLGHIFTSQVKRFVLMTLIFGWTLLLSIIPIFFSSFSYYVHRLISSPRSTVFHVPVWLAVKHFYCSYTRSRYFDL